MKTIFTKKTLGGILAVLLAASVIGCGQPTDTTSQSPSSALKSELPSSDTGAQKSNIPSYLNIDSELPIVKDGEKVTLKIAVGANANSGNPKDVWLWKFVEQKMNIKVEIEQAIEPNEYRSLALNSGNMPDVFIDMAVKPAEMATYGMKEKLLIPITPYINEDIMPELSKIYKENPDWAKRITAPDGNIYSLGIITDSKDVGSLPRAFVNGEWLKKVNMEIPTTLEDFTAMLKAFKGLGDDITPIGGGYGKDSLNPCVLLLNAFGYNTSSASGLEPAIRNGKVVFPYGDREAYGEYLKLMNQYYNEGYISKDFFTLDSTGASADIAGGKNGVIAVPPHIYLKDTFNQWPAVKPLTSAFNEKQIWYASQGTVTTGGFSISSSCKTPEAAARFADYFYKHYEYSQYGPMAGSEDTLGIVCGWKIDPNASGYAVYDDFTNDPKYAGLTSNWTYRLEKINGWPGGAFGYEIPKYPTMFEMQGLKYEKTFDLKTGEGWYRSSVTENLLPYAQMGYPEIAFYPEDVAKRITDLQTVLDVFVKSESAKFITGANSLDKLEEYFASLESMGFPEYLSYFEDYYASVNK